jgi:hypothetical protein
MSHQHVLYRNPTDCEKKVSSDGTGRSLPRGHEPPSLSPTSNLYCGVKISGKSTYLGRIAGASNQASRTQTTWSAVTANTFKLAVAASISLHGKTRLGLSLARFAIDGAVLI